MTDLKVGRIVTKKGNDRHVYYMILGFDIMGTIYLYPIYSVISRIKNTKEAEDYQKKVIESNINLTMQNPMHYLVRQESLFPSSLLINKDSIKDRYNFTEFKVEEKEVISWYLRNKLLCDNTLPTLYTNIEEIGDKLKEKLLNNTLEENGKRKLCIYETVTSFKFLYLGYSSITKMYYYIKLKDNTKYDLRKKRIKAVYSIENFAKANLIKEYSLEEEEELKKIFLERGLRV